MACRFTCVAVVVAAALASPVAAQIRGETVLRGLRNPVAMVPDPTDASVWLVVEQRGVILAVKDGDVLSEPFLDLREVVSSGGERGLLGLALAPDYADSGRLYVNFTDRDGHTVVARFTRHADQPRRADARTRLDLRWPGGRRVIEQPFSNHNGGHLAFGPDGLLYIGLGDGGSAGDPMNHAQRLDSLLGKMLRIDVAVADDDDRGYRIPADNPFVRSDTLATHVETWAFGFRNPWRYSFDDWTRGGTGALLVGDVGQSAREEINFEPAGQGGRNYGWRLREGRQPYDARGVAAFLPLREPLHDYGRAVGGSITGGFVYRGSALDPQYDGRYFYADFISGRVFSLGLHLNAEGEAAAGDEREHTAALGARDTLGMVSSFGHDHGGELLLLNYSAGSIVRIVPDFEVVPRGVTLSGHASGDGMSLRWTVAGGPVPAVEYLVERVRRGAVVERVVVERPEAEFTAVAPDCFRVRARAGSGLAGPASEMACAPAP